MLAFRAVAKRPSRRYSAAERAMVRAAFAEAARLLGAPLDDDQLDAAARIATTPGIDRDTAARRLNREARPLFDAVKRMLARTGEA
ncbi:MAG: hypothetical protein OXH68_17015 [Gammaproteobacteria bacterium]|nr:hypothetical protein [Gammaproteobacteria bacterium]